MQLKHIYKCYGDKKIFTDFSMEIREKETLAVIGESGCGKTTLLRLLAGLDRDYKGQIVLQGEDVRSFAPNVRNAALVLQEPVLWSHMTVKENILFPLSRKERKNCRELLEKIGSGLEIAALMDRYPDEISGGQAKRVSLARALASGRELLLLDEPLSNIDEETKGKILTFLKKEYAGSSTIVYVSHDMEEVKNLCGRVVRL